MARGKPVCPILKIIINKPINYVSKIHLNTQIVPLKVYAYVSIKIERQTKLRSVKAPIRIRLTLKSL